MGTQDTAHEQRCGAHAGPPAAGRPLEPPHGRSRRPLLLPHRRHAPRAGGVAHLGPPHARPGDRRGLRLALHRAAGRRVRGRRDEPPDGLPVHRRPAALLRRRGHLRIDDPRARPRADGAHSRGPHRRALRRRARHHARHRADRRAREPGPLARVAPAHPACGRRPLVNPGVTMFPNATGIVVGYLTAKGSLGLTYGDFEYGARYFFRPLDLWYSAIKSVCFAGALTTIPCYLGFNTQQGAEGVGRATTQAVVAASVSILMLDAVITKLLLVAK